MTILLGDSITVGYAPFYLKINPAAQVVAKVGASISWMREQALSRNGSKVLVMAGTNDLMGASADEVLSRLTVLVTGLQRAGFVPIVGTLPPHRSRETERRKLNSLILGRLPSAEVGTVLQESDMTADGIHPNIAGLQSLAKTWATVADSWGNRTQSTRSESSKNTLLLVGGAAAALLVWGMTRK